VSRIFKKLLKLFLLHVYVVWCVCVFVFVVDFFIKLLSCIAWFVLSSACPSVDCNKEVICAYVGVITAIIYENARNVTH
jgi:hypothetical protein